MNNWLHIVNGSTTTDGLRRAGIPGTTTEFADVLHEGPVLPDDDMDAWLNEFRDYDDVILWYEHDLFDQLLLIRHLSWWWGNAPLDPPQLVSPADYLGPMNEVALLAHFEARARVTESQLVLGASTWHAFTQGDPTALVRIVTRENTAVLPHLQGALLRLLQEYPSTFNGVGRTEQQMLELAALAPRTARELFMASQQREERVFMGDSTFLLRVERLLGGPHPLLQREHEHHALALTDDGRAVLEGAADNVALNGIDRWIGGVHLTDGNVWRWDGTGLASA